MASVLEDVVSWTFGNHEVEDSRTVLVDAVHPERRFSKGEARREVRRIVSGFRDRNSGGPLRGDVVCMHGFNDVYYPIFFLGVIGAGGIFTGTNPAYTSSELAHHFRLSKTRFVLTEPEHFPRISQACAEVDIPLANVFILDFFGQSVPRGTQSWAVLLGNANVEWETLDGLEASQSTTAALFSTSGTTGLPKMAARSHCSLVVESASFLEGETTKPYEQVRLLSAPFFHAFASPLANIIAIRSGTPTYVMRRYDETIFLNSVVKYAITETALAPPVIIKLLSLPEEKKSALRGLYTVWCGGAPLDKIIQQTASDMFAVGARISQVWGMTECGWITTFSYPEVDDTGSVGRPVAGTQVKLVDDHGLELSDPDARGEILAKSPAIMSGYLENVEATKQSITKDGWLRTGDVACIKDGKVYIVDRKKELIKVRGWQVAPAELEGMLLTHPAIIDAAVIGIQRISYDSETPRAYVVRKPGIIIGEDEVKTFLLTKLAKYKVLDCEVRFRNDIPKSPSGKILRKILRDEACKETHLEERHFAGVPAKKKSFWALSAGTNKRDTAFLSLILFGGIAFGLVEVSRLLSRRSLLRCCH